MTSFLFWIGLYNVTSIVLIAFAIWPSFAGTFLSKWIEVTVPPYDVGRHGALWVWWSAMSNIFLAAIMVLATRWPANVQREVIYAVVAVYGAMLVPAIAALWSRNYNRRGIFAVFFLWPAQMAWGIYAAVTG